MNILKRSLACLFVGVGLLFIGVTLEMIFDPTEEDRAVTGVVGAVMGGVPLAGGVLLWRSVGQDKQSATVTEAQRLQTVFYELVQQKQGQFTLLEFAMAAGLPGDQARTFLDSQAKAFNADYDVTENGDLVYQFLLGESSQG